MPLDPFLLNNTIHSVELRRQNLRFPFPEDMIHKLENAKITCIRRRAKYILIHLQKPETPDTIWLTHLGMTGKYTIIPADKPYKLQKHDHVQVSFKDDVKVIYNDPRRFGYMDIFPVTTEKNIKYLAHLGVEPLGNEFHADAILKLFSQQKSSIKAVLLNQKIIAGLGNIYICEALFKSAILPTRLATKIYKKELEMLMRYIVEILRSAIQKGGSTLKDFANTDGTQGYFQTQFEVYGRENKPCYQCQTPIQRIVQAGRSSFFCKVCQK